MPGHWRLWVTRAWPAGVLLTLPLWWLWWTILVTGSPGSLTWMLTGVVLSGIGLATWWWLSFRPVEDSVGRDLPIWILVGEVLLLLVLLTTFWLFRLATVSAPYAWIYVVYAILALLAAQYWLRYPGLHQGHRPVWWPFRERKPEFIALLAGLLSVLAITAIIPIVMPYPALTSAGLITASGIMASLVGGYLSPSAPNWNRVPVRAVLSGLSYPLAANLLVLALFGGNVMPVWALAQSTGNLAEANGLAQSWLPNLATAAVGRSVAWTDAAGAEMVLMSGRDRAAELNLVASQWWAPSSNHLLPIDAWVGSWLPGAPGYSTTLAALRNLGNPGAVDTLMGIWAVRHHRDGRPWFFSALATAPQDLLEMPATIPHPGITGLGSQEALAGRLQFWAAGARAGIVGQLDAHQAWTAALAADAMLRGLVAEAPGGGQELPAEWLAVAAAAWHVDNMPLAARAAVTAWEESSNATFRQTAAQVALESAAMPGYLEAAGPGSTPGLSAIADWASRQPPSPLTLDLVFWQIQGGQPLTASVNWTAILPTVLPELRKVERSSLSASERGVAWSIEATAEQASGHWQTASAAAKQALRSPNVSAQAVGWTTAATVLLNTSGLAKATQIRQDLHRALQADPSQFMVWFTLANVDAAVGRKAAASRAVLQAIQTRNRLVASGQGVYQTEVGSQSEGGSLWPVGTGRWALPNLVNMLDGLANSLAAPALRVNP